MRVRYTCKHCNAANELTSLWKWFWIPHMGSKKLIECKTCKFASFMARQDGRKWLDWPTEKK